MKLTNVHNLPDAIVRAAKKDTRPQMDRRANLGVTRLIDSPRIRVLMKRHRDEIEEDVADRIWAIRSGAMHEFLQKAARPTDIVEAPFFMDALDWTVVAIIDLYEPPEKRLSDYKDMSVWEIMSGLKENKEQQLNLSAHAMRLAGYEVEECEVVAFLRDWSRARAMTEAGYPDRNILRIPVRLWPHEKCQKFLEYRIRLHQEADKELPLCSAEERWAKPDKYAVKKKGRKSALRVLDSREEAEKWMEQSGKGEYIEFRPGEDTRCEKYCPVGRDTGLCSQWEEIRRRHAKDAA